MLQKIDLKGKKALVMGLGLHGGGLASVRYLLSAGAEVTCTDLRNQETLRPTMEALEGETVRYVLGKHRMEDFDAADVIIKNPGVPVDSKWIVGRNNIETDISLFLKSTESPVIAVTGSKGKSTVVTALHYIMEKEYPEIRLGGNIAVSPLSFIDELKADTPVILELSSWQLADLKGRGILKPQIACITNLMHDHQNRYASFADYEADKAVIFEAMADDGIVVFPADDYGEKWKSSVNCQVVLVNTLNDPMDKSAEKGQNYVSLDKQNQGWYSCKEKTELILQQDLNVPGTPFRSNMLFASTIARLWGCKTETILQAQQEFTGVPYRMECFLEKNGIRFFDDTAATIPDATAAAVKAFSSPVVLIAGGTDKELDFRPFEEIADIPKMTILLEGSGTDTIMAIYKSRNIPCSGPWNSMDSAVAEALSLAEPGDVVLLSPGAASFGLFRHEFERGDAFKASSRKLTSNL